MVSASRVQTVNTAPLRPGGDYVLYWMTAARRTRHNFALEHAVARARELGRPLVVLEALRCDYPWASDRHHRFVLAGMRDNAARFAAAGGVGYHAYVEPRPGAGKGLLERLARRACLVVADRAPVFFLPRMLAAAAARLDVALETVDGCGLLPLTATGRIFITAHSFRRFLQRTLPAHLAEAPVADPLRGVARRLPPAPGLAAIRQRWPAASADLLEGKPAAIARLAIDHGVALAAAGPRGGPRAGEAALRRFVAERLDRYADGRNHPDDEVSSGLSPWLHFGHLGSHQVLAAVAAGEGWTPDDLGSERRGTRTGFWGMSASAEAFLDQLVTWRELGFNLAALHPEAERYESLPGWALRTLARHARDPRPETYSLAELDRAATGDPLWNAAQRELASRGTLPNYLRMLWGKRILEWSRNPQAALAAMIELNQRYALDGRDPNSTSGVFWVLGRYDRPWGPERPIFGTVRYMSSAQAARKLRLRRYLQRFSA